jgi:hypothetical protein
MERARLSQGEHPRVCRGRRTWRGADAPPPSKGACADPSALSVDSGPRCAEKEARAGARIPEHGGPCFGPRARRRSASSAGTATTAQGGRGRAQALPRALGARRPYGRGAQGPQRLRANDDRGAGLRRRRPEKGRKRWARSRATLRWGAAALRRGPVRRGPRVRPRSGELAAGETMLLYRRRKYESKEEKLLAGCTGKDPGTRPGRARDVPRTSP